jgi:hypothetical protein
VRVEPHTGLCDQCRQPIIDAEQYGGHTIRLDAKPVADGCYRAFFSTRGYWACVQITGDDGDVFRGMRRRLHACPDHQLELSTEAAVARPNPDPE